MKYETLLDELGVGRGPRSDGWMLVICPLHDDSTPSFSINARSGWWRCWSRCGDGRITDLVCRMKGYSPDQAKAFIARYTDEDEEDGPPLAIDEIKARLGSLTSGLSLSHEEQPSEYTMPMDGLTKERWPLWWGSRGFSVEDWIAWDVWYDERSGDAVFPIRDYRGVLRGEVRRSPKDVIPKYKNNDGLKKELYLFGENRAYGQRHLYLTEGPLDTVWMWHCGLPAVAIFGSHLSRQQYAKLVKMQVEEVTLVFDRDEGGHKAVMSAIKERGIMADVVRMPLGNDPNDIKDPLELRRIVETERVSALRYALFSGER